MHLVDGAKTLLGVDLRHGEIAGGDGRAPPRARGRIPKGRWILGGYWDHEAWPGHALPTRQLIDGALPDHPALLMRLDGHVAVANSRALQLAQASRDDRGAGRRRDWPRCPQANPTASSKTTRSISSRASCRRRRYDETLEAVQAALAHAASVGVTTIHDLTVSADELRVFEALRSAGTLPVRIYFGAVASHRRSDQGRDHTGFGDDWVRIGGVKYFADGSMGAGTAAFYDRTPTIRQPRDSSSIRPTSSRNSCSMPMRPGFSSRVHAIGDRANTLVLDISEKLASRRAVRRTGDSRSSTHRSCATPTSSAFASLGVIASIQPSHCIDDMRWAEKRIGRARCEIAYDFKSFVDAGARIAFGTDWFVEPLNPMLGLYAAVTRQFTDGTPPGGWFPEERISLEQAVSFYTLGSAYAEFAETRKGSIRNG